MKWLNSEYIKELSDEKFYELSKPYFDKSTATAYDYKLIAPLLKTRVDILSDVIEKVAFLADFKEFDKEMFLNKKNKIDFDLAIKCLEIAKDALKGLSD